ncbi:hypothetical protein [Brevibacillus reuszeri]|uniref:hypothetical protein n=1 Tax=Brevibacillus reuszeri TaxID=54915 RepID=UPI000CCC3FE5|nr:hypothetical protein [Brevibacillus reuszeri]
MIDPGHQKDLVDMIWERMAHLGYKQLHLTQKINEIALKQGSENTYDNATVHNILKKNRGMSLAFLMIVTEALGFVEGEFFPEYINQYLIVEHPSKTQVSKQKLNKFINLCIDKGLYEYCRLVVDKVKIIDDPPIAILKGIAEKLEKIGQLDSAIYTYSIITSLVDFKLGENAQIHIKKFILQMELGMSKAYESAVELGVYATYMDDEILKQRAYGLLISTYYLLDDWEKVYLYCDEQLKLVSIKNSGQLLETLVYKIYAARKKRDYKTALELIDQYQKALGVKQSKWTMILRLIIHVEMGDQGALNQLLQLIKNYPPRENSTDRVEYIPFLCLPIILSAFVKQSLLERVPGFMEEFNTEITLLLEQDNLLDIKHIYAFLIARADYNFLIGNTSQGLDDVIQAINCTLILKSQTLFALAVCKFSTYTTCALPHQKSKFVELCTTASKTF